MKLGKQDAVRWKVDDDERRLTPQQAGLTKVAMLQGKSSKNWQYASTKVEKERRVQLYSTECFCLESRVAPFPDLVNDEAVLLA